MDSRVRFRIFGRSSQKDYLSCVSKQFVRIFWIRDASIYAVQIFIAIPGTILEHRFKLQYFRIITLYSHYLIDACWNCHHRRYLEGKNFGQEPVSKTLAKLKFPCSRDPFGYQFDHQMLCFVEIAVLYLPVLLELMDIADILTNHLK